MSILKQFQLQATKFRDDRDWKKFHAPKDLALGLMMEAGELIEHFVYRQGDVLNDYTKSSKEEIADEMSDVLYWLLIMADELDIDLEDAFVKKMAKNAEKYPLGSKDKTG